MKAFINPAYTYALPDRLTVFTAVDALCHLIEGYLSSRASVLTDMMAEGGICAFGCLREHLSMRRFDNEARAALMSVSTLAGIVITHTKTSLPHQLSYALTCHHGIHHGAACGMLLAEFLRRHPDAKKTSRALAMLGLFDFDAFKDWMDGLLGDGAAMSDADIVRHADELLARPGYDATYPGTVTPDDVRAIYKAAASR